MGGEKPSTFVIFAHSIGSPPRGRGKVSVHTTFRLRKWITPAWAGKSEVSKYAAKPGEDHPRMGGEKSSSTGTRWAKWGSPPHGRGKAAAISSAKSLLRITPAWAGKSVQDATLFVPLEDHPRMGGEKIIIQVLFYGCIGSPPHGRGKAHPGRWRRCRSPDHPRMGGEKWILGSPLAHPGGSPPHGRGKAGGTAR